MWTLRLGIREMTVATLRRVGLDKSIGLQRQRVQHPVRPVAKVKDREALRRDLMRRFSKTLAELAK